MLFQQAASFRNFFIHYSFHLLVGPSIEAIVTTKTFKVISSQAYLMWNKYCTDRLRIQLKWRGTVNC